MKEGATYARELELVQESEDEIIPSKISLDGSKSLVMFDIETTGLGRDSEITQIAAVLGDTSFQTYVIPRCNITENAANVTGISFSCNKMYVHGVEVQASSINQALLDLIEYLRSKHRPILVGHNLTNIDIPVLTNKLLEFGLNKEFCTVVCGYVDTLKMSKRAFKKAEVENFRQETLVKKFLNISYGAHNAFDDVCSLQQLFDLKLKGCLTVEDVLSSQISQLQGNV